MRDTSFFCFKRTLYEHLQMLFSDVKTWFWLLFDLSQISPSVKLQSSLLPLPLYDQPPISPFTSPETSTPPPLPRSPSAALNGEHKLPLPAASYKGQLSSHSKTHRQLSSVDTILGSLCPYLSSLASDQSSGRSPVSPGFSQPLRFTPEGGPGKLRPVSMNTVWSTSVKLQMMGLLWWWKQRDNVVLQRKSRWAVE